MTASAYSDSRCSARNAVLAAGFLDVSRNESLNLYKGPARPKFRWSVATEQAEHTAGLTFGALAPRALEWQSGVEMDVDDAARCWGRLMSRT